MSLAAMVLADRIEGLTRYYDRWMHLITFGRDEIVRRAVLRYIHPGERVLDAGCGTGTLAVAAAGQGAKVVGFDRSERILSLARAKAIRAAVDVRFRKGETLAPPLEGETFDVATATFVLSELSPDEAVLTVRTMAEAVRPGGRIIIADEGVPQNPLLWLIAALQRLLVGLVAFIFAQRLAPTHPHEWPRILEEAGLAIDEQSRYQAGALIVMVAQRPAQLPSLRRKVLPLATALPRGLAAALLRLAAWFALPIPIPHGVYRLGSPKPESPVLLTSNFLATVDAVRAGLAGLDCYLIAEDTGGWNVWCASDAGIFTAEKAAVLIRLYQVEGLVTQRRVIVPRLGMRVRFRLAELSGWDVVAGPIEARDLADFLQKLEVTPAMKSLDRMYRLQERLRVGALTTVQLPLWLLPLRLLSPSIRRPVWRFGLAASWVLAIFHYNLPGRTGVVKGGLLGVAAAAAMLVARPRGWARALAVALSAPFIGWIYQSTSPVVYWKRLWK